MAIFGNIYKSEYKRFKIIYYLLICFVSNIWEIIVKYLMLNMKKYYPNNIDNVIKNMDRKKFQQFVIQSSFVTNSENHVKNLFDELLYEQIHNKLS